MATVALVDARRLDTRQQTLENPVWLTSGPISYTTATKGVLLFSFPISPIPDNLAPYGAYAPGAEKGVCGKLFLVRDAVFVVEKAFAGATTPAINIGFGTIATDAAKDGDNITYTANNGLIPTADITSGTAGYYPPATAVTRANAKITCADTNVPCIFAMVTAASGTYTAGIGRLHVLITRLPA